MKCFKLAILSIFLFSPIFQLHASPYTKTIKKWTKHDEVYRVSDFSARIIWRATPINAEVSEAQTDLYQKLYESDRAEAENFTASILEKGQGDAMFFVSFYSPEKKFDDWLNPKGYWKIRLKSGDQTWDATHIERISRITPMEARLYPYLIPWATGYYVSFPVSRDRLNGDFSIAVYNPEVSSTLSWSK